MLSRLLLTPGARRLDSQPDFPLDGPLAGRRRTGCHRPRRPDHGLRLGPQANPDDPLEPMNRVTFKVNDTVDQYVAVPDCQGLQGRDARAGAAGR